MSIQVHFINPNTETETGKLVENLTILLALKKVNGLLQ